MKTRISVAELVGCSIAFAKLQEADGILVSAKFPSFFGCNLHQDGLCCGAARIHTAPAVLQMPKIRSKNFVSPSLQE